MARRLSASGILAASLVALTVATALMSLGGCGEEETDPAALDGTRWRLVRWSESTLSPTRFTITADFADGRIGGTSAVNSYGGSYATGPGDGFSTGELASTLMAGPEDAMRAEKAYIERLEAAASFTHEGDRLTLYDTDGKESLVFEPAVTP